MAYETELGIMSLILTDLGEQPIKIKITRVTIILVVDTHIWDFSWWIPSTIICTLSSKKGEVFGAF